MSDDKFVHQHLELINQLKRKGITDKKVLEVMARVPRHEFIEKRLLLDPYEDAPQSIGSGQTISQPYIVALMTEKLFLKEAEKVLEIGTGCGYQTAILCELSEKVFSVERIENLHKLAASNLTKLGYKNFQLNLGDGTMGWEEYAPYDAIMVTAKAPEIPETLIAQLAQGGRLVIPVGKTSAQKLLKLTKHKDGFVMEHLCDVVFVPLIGKYGWSK